MKTQSGTEADRKTAGSQDAVVVRSISFSYGDFAALSEVTFTVKAGTIFGFLGPNGSGKTTLFRILSTFLEPHAGEVLLAGNNLVSARSAARHRIGVVFQAPSLDDRLTVTENMIHQGHLYGLSGKALKDKAARLLLRFGMHDRAGEIVGKLSGGMKRRVELAKGLLHDPELLLLDEPSTGLDPGARRELWKYLRTLQGEDGVTILLTTHLLEEAEECDRLLILNGGQVVCENTPAILKEQIGADVLEIVTGEPAELQAGIRERFKMEALIVDGTLQIEERNAAALLPKIVEAFPGRIRSATFRKPTLEDVFSHHTGHRFWEEKVAE